jgi:hypothetical protein
MNQQIRAELKSYFPIGQICISTYLLVLLVLCFIFFHEELIN